jgi:aspartate/tyrosine/aromatic aminotransferase
LHTLLGLNRVYYFGFKWIEVVDQRLTIKPDKLLNRIRSAYSASPAEGAQLVIDLVEDTFMLVETHLPEVNVARLREIFRYRRPTWESVDNDEAEEA